MDIKNKYNRVAVVMGGNSGEREVSLLSGKAVLESLKRSGVNAYAFDPYKANICQLVEQQIDCAIIMLHGRGGEDGTIQGALEYLKIPYSGSGIAASAIALDKNKTKLIWRSMQIPVAKWQYLTYHSYNQEKFKLELNLPVIVKPCCEGSTLGLSKVYDHNNLLQAINMAFEYDSEVLVEELIVGSEFTVTIFNDKVYPLVKIEAPSGEYDYTNKYFTDTTKYICPYDLGDELNRDIQRLSLLAYNSVGASGVARVDFMLNSKNELFFLEINTIPGMTSHSLVPISFKAVGKDFDDLCLSILGDAKLHIR